MNWLRSHLTFDRGQRDGILLLVVVIIALIALNVFVEFGKSIPLDLSSPQLIKIQHEIDSLKLLRKKENNTKLYPFNPNYITEFKAYTLGLTVQEFDRLVAYRQKDQWINSAEDFQRVTGVHDSLLSKISPSFKFPEWVNKPKKRYSFSEKPSNTELSYTLKTDLNLATEIELQQVQGIGKTLSKRIVSYRDKLGGFSGDDQLYSVYGLRTDVVEKVKRRFTVKTPKGLSVINVNNASASDIATIPGISFDLAREIWEYVRLREGIDNLVELEKIEGITERKLRLIRLYLSVD